MAGTVDMYHVIKGLKPSASSSISILPYYGLSDNFIVLIGKISMFFLKKSRMELKCKCYDVMDVEVLNVFYHTKSTSDTETDFLRHRIIQVLDRIYNVTFRDANLYSPSCLPYLEPE